MSKGDLRPSDFDCDSSYDYYLRQENQVLIDCTKYNSNLQVCGTCPILSFVLEVKTTKKKYGDMYGKIVLNLEKRLDTEKSESKDQNRGEYLA